MGQSGIETSTYLDRYGLRGVVRISSEWHEKKSGFQPETTDEELACIMNGEYWRLHFQRHQTFGPGSGPPDDRLTPVRRIERAEYEQLRAEFGILDTPEYFEQRRTDAAKAVVASGARSFDSGLPQMPQENDGAAQRTR